MFIILTFIYEDINKIYILNVMLYSDILHGLLRDIACANEVLIHDTWDRKLSD